MAKILQKDIFNRSQLLLGNHVMDCISSAKIIIFGVGGVGSWCAESLIRSGIKNLTIVDSDRIAVSNINRQLMATTLTIGRVKVEALKEHLLTINPEANIIALQKVYNEDNADSFNIDEYDYVVDAIDSLQEKTHLILYATDRKVKLFSSMGAALRIDATQIKTAEFWKVKGDPLARTIRNKFKKQKTFPKSKFICVFSEETPLQNAGINNFLADQSDDKGEWNQRKVHTNGSLHHITGIFGITLAGLIIKDIWQKEFVK